jgi:lipoprotein-anchoring transpeptidase ErfK/SrfK
MLNEHKSKNGEITTMPNHPDVYLNSTCYRKFQKQTNIQAIYFLIPILIIFFVGLLVIPTEASSLPPAKEPVNPLKSNGIRISYIEYLNKPNIQIAYKIMPGDTLFSIARKHYESTESITKLQLDNNIKNPSVDFKAGNTINISNPKVIELYKVKPGDTIYSITQRYFNRGWYTDYVQTVNGINNPNTDIKTGMKLSIPLTKSTAIHTVQPGETLYGIILKYYQASVFQELIIEHNEIADPTNIKAGLAIKIPNPFYTEKSILKGTISRQKPSYYIEIDKSNNSLAIFNNKKLVRTLPVATGKNTNLTPVGTFKIVNKIKDPWYSPKGIPGGTPRNPLGTRWLGLSVPNTNGTKYGIHGTNNPSSIGKYASLGCVRMNNIDVQWLYDHIPTGTVVVIKN